ETGRPFVGRAGKLLDEILAAIGFRREEVFICNVLKCRPPGNRNPEPLEVTACSPYLHRQLELIGPRVILAMGLPAAHALLGGHTSLGELRMKLHRYRGIPLMVTYHPAALLRNPHSTRPCAGRSCWTTRCSIARGTAASSAPCWGSSSAGGSLTPSRCGTRWTGAASSRAWAASSTSPTCSTWCPPPRTLTTTPRSSGTSRCCAASSRPRPASSRRRTRGSGSPTKCSTPPSSGSSWSPKPARPRGSSASRSCSGRRWSASNRSMPADNRLPVSRPDSQTWTTRRRGSRTPTW
ncbi:MAG: hypothetical protein B7Z72_15360, partial [Gemmatimonadetes bacterium 21-71-4]